MTITFESGDGSFDIIIEDHEPVPAEWVSCAAAEIWRKDPADGRLFLIKARGKTTL